MFYTEHTHTHTEYICMYATLCSQWRILHTDLNQSLY